MLRVSEGGFGRVGDGAYEHGTVLAVDDLFAFGVGGDFGGLSTDGGRIAGEEVDERRRHVCTLTRWEEQGWMGDGMEG